jgi:hypothetical protein
VIYFEVLYQHWPCDKDKGHKCHVRSGHLRAVVSTWEFQDMKHSLAGLLLSWSGINLKFDVFWDVNSYVWAIIYRIFGRK